MIQVNKKRKRKDESANKYFSCDGNTHVPGFVHLIHM